MLLPREMSKVAKIELSRSCACLNTSVFASRRTNKAVKSLPTPPRMRRWEQLDTIAKERKVKNICQELGARLVLLNTSRFDNLMVLRTEAYRWTHAAADQGSKVRTLLDQHLA